MEKGSTLTAHMESTEINLPCGLVNVIELVLCLIINQATILSFCRRLWAGSIVLYSFRLSQQLMTAI